MSQKTDLICGIVLFMVVTGTLNASSVKANAMILDELLGEWLNKNYSEALKKTRSPMKAVGGYPMAFKISKDGRLYQWLLIYGFHEAISRDVRRLIATNQSHTYVVEYDEGKSSTLDKFIIKKENSINEIIWLSKQHNKEKTFSFVRAQPNIETYINRTVLAGSYRDLEGNNFIFNESGEAKWPDKTFRYQVNLDQEGVTCDMFAVSDGPDVIGYGFTWQDTKLLVFNVKEIDDMIYCDRQPWLILSPR
jgi:hypothetical protein